MKMNGKVLLGVAAGLLCLAELGVTAQAAEGGRDVPHYDIREKGGTWDGTNYQLPDGTIVTDAFFCDGTYTYYLMMDGTPMKDRLSYHPDGEHVIYLDAEGHEVFSNFTHVAQSIEGNPVDDLCFFDVYGHMYVDVLTYDQAGENLYYANAYGVMERNGWFRFSDNGIGYANPDGTLAVNEYRQDWNGDDVWLEANGYAKGSWSYGVETFYHTRGDVRNYMANSGAGAFNATELKTEPNLTAPYAPGTVTEKSLNDALAMLNQMRYIAGLSYDVALNDDYVQMAQAGAFVNAVNNRGLSHYPSRPEGMSDELYELGYDGASSSNLAYAYGWGRSFSLSDFMEMWMDDSDSTNIDRLGHRRWILNPSMKATGFGYAVSGTGAVYGSVYVFDDWNKDTGIRGVAWPAREMPAEYFGDDMAWSYSYGEVLNMSNISVTLTCLNQEKYMQWNFSEENSDGYFNVENSNRGQNGCVIFRPAGINIREGDEYLVNISQNGETLATYMVSFF